METQHRLAPLLTPRSIAVVGASSKPGTPGNFIISEIRRGGFEGALYAVNPGYDEVEGLPCRPSLGDLPEPADLALLVVANHRLEAQLADAIDAGTRAAVIYASCHLGDDGDPPLLDRLRRRARAAGLLVCGGNGMGFYNLDAGVWACPYAIHGGLEPGPVALVSHSGSAFSSLLDLGKRMRFNLAVSPGQEITATAADYLDYALDMPTTRVAALFLEAVRDAHGFTAALAKAAGRAIPVVALKVGRTAEGARSALTHSGAIAGSDAAFQALCDRYGVIRVDTLDELVATTSLLAQPRRAAAGSLAAILDSGGERGMLVDVAEGLGVPFADINDDTRGKLAARLGDGLEPVNPCDAWDALHGFEQVFADCFRALVNDPDTAIGVFFADLREGRFLAEPYVRACRAAAAGCDKPVALATIVGRARYGPLADRLLDDGIPVLDGMDSALKAVRNALAWRDFRARPPLSPPSPPRGAAVGRWRARLGQGGALDEAEGLALLTDFGIPTLPVHVAGDRDAALAAAESLGYPVAMKTAAPGVRHKSDVAGVKLDLATSDAAAAAYDDLAARLGPRVLVAPMAGGGVEIALGLTIDPQFGPVVMVGAGGTMVEVLRDARFALAPFDAAAAERLIDGLRVRPLLAGARGAPPADVGALAQTIARFSALAAELGDVLGEIDVNPLLAGPKRCVALDALVAGRGAGEA